MKEVILAQRAELNNLYSKKYHQRTISVNIEAYLASGLIKLITGPRRAGKSVFALQMLQSKRIAYLNFDDIKLLNNFDEDNVMQALLEVYPQFEFLFLDEIQNLDSWQLWVSKFYRNGINLVITGSNAKMLSSEIATSLTGRYIEIFMLPFSLSEYLEYKRINTSPQNIHERAIYMKEIESYMKVGGFPEIANNREIASNYLGTLYDSIILKDLAQRHKIRKTQELYNLSDFLISNYCNQLSYNEIARNLNMRSVATIEKFCNYLTEPYLFFFLPRFDYKLREMKKASKKIYVVDNGFIYSRSFELSSNNDRQLENMVFVELLRRTRIEKKYDLFYYRTKNDREIDFVIKKDNKVSELIQVSLDISNSKTREREFRALIEASKELICNNLILITWDKTETINYKNCEINIISIADWYATPTISPSEEK